MRVIADTKAIAVTSNPHFVSRLLATLLLLAATTCFAQFTPAPPPAKVPTKPEVKPTVVDAATEAAARRGLADLERKLKQDPETPVAGNPKGDVTIVEFFDYTCLHCRSAARHMKNLLAADPGVRLVFKEFPIRGPQAEFFARAALAAHRQGKYVEMHWGLMITDGPDGGTVEGIAKRNGINMDKLKQDMQSPDIKRILAENERIGSMLRIESTPTYIIGDSMYASELSLEGLKEAIRQERAKLKK